MAPVNDLELIVEERPNRCYRLTRQFGQDSGWSSDRAVRQSVPVIHIMVRARGRGAHLPLERR
jgi:hypothetical protein